MVQYNVVKLPIGNKNRRAVLLALEDFEYNDLMITGGKPRVEPDEQFMAKGKVLPFAWVIGAFELNDPIEKAERQYLNAIMGDQALKVKNKKGHVDSTSDNMEILYKTARRLTEPKFALIVINKSLEVDLIDVVGRTIDILDL